MEAEANEQVQTPQLIPVCIQCIMQLSAMELRCRSVVSEKNSLEEKLGEVEREKKTSEKKIQQVSRGGGEKGERGMKHVLFNGLCPQCTLRKSGIVTGTNLTCRN